LALGRAETVANQLMRWVQLSGGGEGAVEVMAKHVGEATDNKFQIQTFAGGEIVPGLQVLDAVQNGTVEMGHTASYYYFGKDPTFAFGTSVPFGLNARMQNAWMLFGGAMDLKRFGRFAG
jgi:TRAP-type mannitol/chloroaromatic compound transport system substrate-binding protein